MTYRLKTTRRRVLQLLGTMLGTTVMGLAARPASFGSRGADDVELQAVADRLIAHKHSAAVIGAHYLANIGSEHSIELLAKAMREGMPAGDRVVDERFLLSRIQSDFERGEVVNLQGWVLSRTEARLCALFAARG